MTPEPEPDACEGPDIQRLCRFLSERSPQPMVAVEGLAHVVTYANPAFAALVGGDRRGLVGRPFAEAVPEGDGNGCLALLDRVFRAGVAENLAEQEHRQPNPRPVFWSYAVWAIPGADGRPAGAVVQVTDATEAARFHRQATAVNEALLVSAARQHALAAEASSLGERLRAAVRTRDHFLAVLSHELRNPLAALSTGLHLCTTAGMEPDAARSTLAMMGRQMKQLVRLVDDLLDASRIATGKLALRAERVDLAAVLATAIDASRGLIDAGGHTLTVTPPPEPVTLHGDPTRLAQVFANLLGNAARYSEPGGRIRLTVERAGGEVVVRVTDTGIGIAAADLPHLFDVFVQVDSSWQRAQGGLGIGLSLVKEFVELHGGRVGATSGGPGLGSVFTVVLPVAAAAEAETVPAPARRGRAATQARVLVVDDNADAAESLALMLELMGHEVRTAADGEAGVAAAAAFGPDLILMDLGMPRVSGYEAARRIRAAPGGDRPFLVALTGWGADADRERTRDAGFDRHLVKPVGPEALAALLAELPARPPTAVPSPGPV